ncbi:hypothetical protein A3C59_03715 [Candidatus Daviesbacteria bacterium RIFCSPHIGHO2_02_FULL_36_13]|uniref:Response regulatory domain-containing protein n=1 Tax=Candidatus Daviesbacteria bacterium RIFCSPHIGHO2_02_FULL_36_13 TaxID=1797768 RepID=A0A1F5JX28_9BACT|nr:MAG: hypothetical protein A3C59_03715 [Candidatus Daviesbacteria bacterium RIFCSPHIGHO2_02_FULL_36_13]
MKKILIVEDEIPLLKALADRLTREGFSTLEAKDGLVGLNVALEEHPDLILLDIIMPGMDGMEMLEKLKVNPLSKNIPVILLSNLGDTSKILEGIEAGAESYLIKANVKLEDVVKIVKEKLGVNIA